jgi:hypothetical protein
MKRKGGGGEDVSLDSLLDTMTNVVAILVIMLIVTQLGVSDAVKRIAKTKPVDLQKLAEQKQELAERSEEFASLQQQIAVASDISPEQLELQLRNVKKEIDAAQVVLNESAQKKQSLLLLDAAQKQQEEKARDVEELTKEIAVRLADIQKVEAQLEETPLREAPAAKVVNLPNPRPAPQGSRPFLFLVRDEQVFPVDVDGFRQRAKEQAAQIIRTAKLDRDPEAGIDAARFVELFNKKKLFDDYFEVTVAAKGSAPYLVFKPRADKGESLKSLTRPRSLYQRFLQTLDPSKWYASFLVWPDSFETYLTARAVAAEIGLSAGWAPQNTTADYEVYLGNEFKFGPPPKPQPNTGPEKPPAQPDRPKPVDTID